MNYLTDEQIEYCKANPDKHLLQWVGERLILENVDETEYLSIMEEAFPTMEDEYKALLKTEVIPKIFLREYDTSLGFHSFVEATPLATLKIDTFGEYTLTLGTATNTKKDISYETEYILQVFNGKFYEGTIVHFEDKDGNEQEIRNSKLKLSIRLRIKYAYNDGDSTFVAFRVGKDKKDRISEVSQAIDTIKTLYHLSPKDCYNLKLYFDDVLPKYLQYDKPSDARISVIDNVIHINYPVEFNEYQTLQALIDMKNVTTQKELMDFLMLYVPITPFNVQLRQREMILSLPLALGKGGAGKSAMVKTIVVKGFDNPDAEKSEDDIFTKASFRENFSKSIYPIMIDEITQFTMQKIYGSMKNLATGKGTHSRGRPTGGLNEWTLSAVPIFTSNEAIYIDSGMERRFFKIIATDTDNNIQEWRKAKAKLPDGFLYLFLKEIDGMTIDDLEEQILLHVEKDEDYVYAYQLFIKSIMDKVFERNGLKCPFEPVKKVVYDDDDWYVAFGEFLMENIYDMQNDNHPYLKAGYDYEISDSDEIYVTKLGFQKFLKLFPRCPFRTASTFALNAPEDSNFIITYKKTRACNARNPIHVISVYEKPADKKQKTLETVNPAPKKDIITQLDTKIQDMMKK